MMATPSLFFSRTGEPTLRYEVHAPEGKASGAVFLTHGYAEHSGRYRHVIDALTQRGLVVASYDLRGHGHSEGPRGYIERFDDYLRDARALLGHLQTVEAWRAGGKPALLGHSLGGLITFHLGLELTNESRGAVLSSPFFGLALDVPAPKRLAGTLLSRVLPRVALPSDLRGKDLTHDSKLARAYDEDPLLVKKVPARWFTEAMAAQQRAFERASSWKLPLLLLHGAADKVAAPASSRALFERIQDPRKELRLLDDQYHEIFNEIDRDRWIRLAADSLARFCAPLS
ncbi:MAG: lysophospholipase [Polyangiaceae bacterium]|jgi:alpha-beta hydrolase superfamily lysophospholipase|nr:lysophospholipase [Polyangiaceae bacterium]